MRDIQIASECENAGIIMESDDWDGNIIPKRNGENIIKYIFLFIPRIIINICKKIHAWWVGLKQKYLEKAEAKYDEALFKDVSGEMLRLCGEINAHLAGGNVTYTGSGFVYMSRIKDINGVAAYYEEFEKRFAIEMCKVPFLDIVKKLERLSEYNNAKGVVIITPEKSFDHSYRKVLSMILNYSGFLLKEVEE